MTRAPVTCEWVRRCPSPTRLHDDALFCETKDGIKLYGGCAIAARILEEDAYQYLYHFGERKLEEVIDTNVRGFAQMELASRVKEKSLEQVQKNKASDFNEVLQLTKAAFHGKGITIDYLGNDGGYEYQNPRVQASIDSTVLADVQTQINEQEKLAADVRQPDRCGEGGLRRRRPRELQLTAKDAALELSLKIDYLTTLAEAEDPWPGQAGRRPLRPRSCSRRAAGQPGPQPLMLTVPCRPPPPK